MDTERRSEEVSKGAANSKNPTAPSTKFKYGVTKVSARRWKVFRVEWGSAPEYLPETFSSHSSARQYAACLAERGEN